MGACAPIDQTLRFRRRTKKIGRKKIDEQFSDEYFFDEKNSTNKFWAECFRVHRRLIDDQGTPTKKKAGKKKEGRNCEFAEKYFCRKVFGNTLSANPGSLDPDSPVCGRDKTVPKPRRNLTKASLKACQSLAEASLQAPQNLVLTFFPTLFKVLLMFCFHCSLTAGTAIGF